MKKVCTFLSDELIKCSKHTPNFETCQAVPNAKLRLNLKPHGLGKRVLSVIALLLGEHFMVDFVMAELQISKVG